MNRITTPAQVLEDKIIGLTGSTRFRRYFVDGTRNAREKLCWETMIFVSEGGVQ